MLAEQNDVFKDAAQTVYDFSRDDKIRKVCEDREDYFRNINGMQQEIEQRDRIIAEKENMLSEKDDILAKKESYIAKLEAMLAEKDK